MASTAAPVNWAEVDDVGSWEPFCQTSPARDLLGSEGFAHFGDSEADGYFGAFGILRKEKRLVERISRGKTLNQADIGYIGRKN